MAQDWNGIGVQYSKPLLRGALAGFVATIPMTLFMLFMQRLLPSWQQYALPPERITDELADRADVKKHIGKPQRIVAALVSHFSYGATMGAFYGLLTKVLPLPSALNVVSVLKGMTFGIIVWAASYLGWLPSMGFSEAAPKETIRRNALMIAAHLIWGAVTGMIADIRVDSTEISTPNKGDTRREDEIGLKINGHARHLRVVG